MSLKQKRRVHRALGFALVAIVGGLAWSRLQNAAVQPEELLPADSVLYLSWSGISSQQAHTALLNERQDFPTHESIRRLLGSRTTKLQRCNVPHGLRNP